MTYGEAPKKPCNTQKSRFFFFAQSAKYALHCAQYAKCLDWTADEIIGKHTVRKMFLFGE